MTSATYRSWFSFWQSPVTVYGRFVISTLTAPNPSIRSAWNTTIPPPPLLSYLDYEKRTSLLNWFVSRKHTHTQIPIVILLVWCTRRTKIRVAHNWCVRFVRYSKPAVQQRNGNGSDTLTSSMALTPAWKTMVKKIPYSKRTRKFITVFIKSRQSTSIAHYETDEYSQHTASLSLSLSLSLVILTLCLRASQNHQWRYCTKRYARALASEHSTLLQNLT
jgi:hypothetical protein